MPTCMSCAGSLVEGARFCPYCGDRVHDEAAPPDHLRKLLEQALGTHYQIVRELGRGGMGAVYLAHESGLDRHVAIKVLPPDKAQSEQYRERFRREARIAARLNHPNVVPLHAFGEHEGMLYYVMGYVEGESLAERLKPKGRLPEPEARRILIAVADALHYAHQQGVVHRDVKPQNILLEAGSGRPMLTDFGIAKVTAEGTALTSTGMLIGTPDYMSPEQALGSSQIGPSSDVYSLGVVAYAMLSGKLPFEGTTPGEVIARRLTGSAAPLQVTSGEVSPTLAGAVMRCLAKEPERRWPDAGTFARFIAHPEEDEGQPLPELAQVERMGLVLLTCSYVALLSGFLWKSAESPGLPLELAGKVLPAVAGLVAVVLVGAVVYAKRRGLPSSVIAYHVFREPASWKTWYPRRLRNPGNVWDRLPADVRRFRAALDVFLLGALLSPIAGAAAVGGVLAWSPASRLFRFLVLAPVWLTLALMAVWLFQAWRIPRRLIQKGLTKWEARRFAYEAPLSRASFWSRPAIAALLGTPTLPIGSGSPPDDPTRLDAATRATVGLEDPKPAKPTGEKTEP